VVNKAFGQRRKCVRNSLKEVIKTACGLDEERVGEIMATTKGEISPVVEHNRRDGNLFASKQFLPENWASMRPEEFTAAEFVELTRLIFGSHEKGVLESKVWRKKKHGANN